MDSEWPDVPDYSLGQWDTSVLGLIGEEGLARFTFDGLKRRLGAHPETLSRVLHRLEGQGMIEKSADGYKVTTKLRKILRSKPLSAKERSIPVLQTLLPPDITARQAVSDLGGRWFGTLRWLGYARNTDNITLKWITEDGGIQVDAVFSEGALSIEAKMILKEDLNTVLRASHQLFGYISRIYSRPDRVQHAACLMDFVPSQTLRWM